MCNVLFSILSQSKRACNVVLSYILFNNTFQDGLHMEVNIILQQVNCKEYVGFERFPLLYLSLNIVGKKCVAIIKRIDLPSFAHFTKY